MTVKRAAVLGHPIAHSLSPTLHNAAYAALGLTGWSYEAFDTPPERLAERMTALDETWAGYSVTMPLKHDVVNYLSEIDEPALLTGAVNTVIRHNDGTLLGHNTDVFGIAAALREAGGRQAVRSAVVLGTGATAFSTLVALAGMGVDDVVVLARNAERARETAQAARRTQTAPACMTLPPPRAAYALARADVVVSTTPKHVCDELAVALTARGTGDELGVLLDVVYDPRPTALMTAWAAAGGTAVGGERMLLHQATEQVRLMTGREAPLAAMDAALQGALVAG
ncbi:MAG: shikimate dehydrogenase [Promicromonosporaceae bacterium]|nr:shikimate dehydrogenase [Promicromonosporaceae bacterium]